MGDLARSGAPSVGTRDVSVDGGQCRRRTGWERYTLAMLFSLVGCLFTYARLRLQHRLPLNPQGLRSIERAPGVQHSGQLHDQHQLAELRRGKHEMSYFSQMVGLAFHLNFVSAAGIAIAAALVRGIARRSAKPWATLGGLVRVTSCCCCPFAWCSRSFLSRKA